MLLRDLKDLTAGTLGWLREALRARSPTAASVTSRTFQRKLAPIDDVVARVGREPFAPD